MKDANFYTNSTKFDKKIGLLEEEDLIALGWDADNGNRICYSKHEELWDFIEFLNAIPDGERYHIATDLDSCDIEENFREENGLTEDDLVAGDSIVNTIAFVNRMDYYLCNGDSNDELYLESAEEV